MGETRDEIADHIENKRGDLRSNFEELEDKVKSVTDWRQQFRNNPGVLLALAFGGGVLLAGALRHSRRRADQRPPLAEPVAKTEEPRAWETPRKTRLSAVWDDIQGAILGVVTSKIADTLAEVVPGFQGHFAARRAGSSASSNGHRVQGEGDYEAARRYQADVRRYVRSANIERAARAAAPKNEEEAHELADAEAAGRERAKPS